MKITDVQERLSALNSNLFVHRFEHNVYQLYYGPKINMFASLHEKRIICSGTATSIGYFVIGYELAKDESNKTKEL